MVQMFGIVFGVICVVESIMFLFQGNFAVVVPALLVGAFCFWCAK